MVYGIALSRIAFRRNRAYMLNHAINTFGSFLFGYIYASIWRAMLLDDPQADVMVTYVMVNQSILWVTMFVPPGAFIPKKVREGSIAFDLLRPYSLINGSFFESLGHCIYQFLFRSIPIYALGLLLLGIQLPRPELILPFGITVFNGFIISFFLNYYVGLWSIRFLSYVGAHTLYLFLTNLLSGSYVPAQYYPGVLRQIMPYLPFAATIYLPTQVYLGLESPLRVIGIQLCWIIFLGFFAWVMTRKVLEGIAIQGG